MIGQKFENRKNGRVATIVKFDEKAKSCVLTYDDGNGGTTVSTATLMKSWKRLQADVETAVETAVATEEEVASDGTPYKEIAKEIVKDGKKAKSKAVKEKKQRVKKEKAPDFDSQELRKYVIDYCKDSLKATITERKKSDGSTMNKVALKINNHMFATMSWSKKIVSVNVRSCVKGSEAPTKMFENTIFGAHYIVSEDTDTVRSMIVELLSKAVEDQVNRKSKKEDK